jgi:O-succinylhomoserine sulfhydrylase
LEKCLTAKYTFVIYRNTINPLAQVGDMQAIADIAHAHGALFAVDNCFCTPALQQPIKFGADLVLYSATKYIDGQGRAGWCRCW